MNLREFFGLIIPNPEFHLLVLHILGLKFPYLALELPQTVSQLGSLKIFLSFSNLEKISFNSLNNLFLCFLFNLVAG